MFSITIIIIILILINKYNNSLLKYSTQIAIYELKVYKKRAIKNLFTFHFDKKKDNIFNNNIFVKKKKTKCHDVLKE